MDQNNVLDFLGQPMDVVTGEIHRWRDEMGHDDKYYVALAKCLEHNIIFNYTHIEVEPLNYIDEIIHGVPEFAANYLLNVMQNNTGLLIYMSRYMNEDSCYDIYYDFPEEGNDMSIDEIVNWMQLNNDFSAVNYRYTEIKNGKQNIPG